MADPGSRPRRASPFAAGGLALLLAACAAGPTPYQPQTDGYGYSQQQIERNRYRVTFAGNASTSLDTVRNYLTYRAAEVTLESGHDYFIVVDQHTERATTYHGTGSSPFGFGGGFGSGGFGIGISTFSAYPNDSYTAWADIIVGDGPEPADNLDAYDARDVIRQLDASVLRAPGAVRIVPPRQDGQQAPGQTPEQP